VTWQVALAPLPDSVQGVPVKRPARELVKLTVPVGVTGGPWPVSVTVAAQLTARPIVTLDGQQNTDVVVCR